MNRTLNPVFLPSAAPLLSRKGWAVFLLALIAVCAVAPVLNLWVPRGSFPHLSDYGVGLLGRIMLRHLRPGHGFDLGLYRHPEPGSWLVFALGGYAMGMYLMRRLGWMATTKAPCRTSWCFWTEDLVLALDLQR